MGIFKEEAHAFEEIERWQKQIYDDAADYGYPYDTSDPPAAVVGLIRAVKTFQELDKRFPGDRPMVRSRETWRDGVAVTVRIAWEADEGYEHGSEYVISFNKTKRHPSLIDKSCDAFVSVYSRRYAEKV